MKALDRSWTLAVVTMGWGVGVDLNGPEHRSVGSFVHTLLGFDETWKSDVSHHGISALLKLY